jgi:hypothetical protein
MSFPEDVLREYRAGPVRDTMVPSFSMSLVPSLGIQYLTDIRLHSSAIFNCHKHLQLTE